MNAFKNTNNTIAMLCKTSVARNILVEISKNRIATKLLRILKFNARKGFGISASACVLIIGLSTENESVEKCQVLDMDSPDEIKDMITYKNGVLSSALHIVEDFEGECEFTWRQGVKHDCAGVMELTKKHYFAWYTTIKNLSGRLWVTIHPISWHFLIKRKRMHVCSYSIVSASRNFFIAFRFKMQNNHTQKRYWPESV